MKPTNYTVIFETFTERHFIKTFAKKYKGAWDNTLKGLTVEFSFFDLLFLKNTAETIIDSKEIKICKTEFRVHGTKESRHASGNRCIVAIHKDTNKVCVLLVYGKTDFSPKNETAQWQNLIKMHYPKYKDLF